MVSIELSFSAEGNLLVGELDLPDDRKGPVPGILLSHNREGANRDLALERWPGYASFRELAEGLTQQGIAVFRYDKRGFGKSTGERKSDDLNLLAGDLAAAWATLLTRQEIAPDATFLLGQSQGAQLVVKQIHALSRRRSVAGLILLSSAVEGSALRHVNRPVLLIHGEQDESFDDVPRERVVESALEEAQRSHPSPFSKSVVLPETGHLLAPLNCSATGEWKLHRAVVPEIATFVHAVAQPKP